MSRARAREMTDWVTISSLATGGGTLVLAVATYGSVRSANRAARVAEQSMRAGVRPVLIPSRDTDASERVRFGDGVLLDVPGHGGAAEYRDRVSYLAVALRNGGTGLACLQGWRARAMPERAVNGGPQPRLVDGPSATPTVIEVKPDLNEFRRQMLDLYIPAGETGYWQGALRDPSEPGYTEVREAIEAGKGVWLDLLYGDYQGTQRSIVRLAMSRFSEDETLRAFVLRYWFLEEDDPR